MAFNPKSDSVENLAATVRGISGPCRQNGSLLGLFWGRSHSLLAKRIEIPWPLFRKWAGVILRPIQSITVSWKSPIAIAMFLCSLVPVWLLYFIYQIDFRSSYRAFKHITPPHIPIVFYENCRYGFALPALTAVLGLWFVFGKAVSPVKFAWLLLGLTVLHLLWLAYGILGFYLANQHFVMF